MALLPFLVLLAATTSASAAASSPPPPPYSLLWLSQLPVSSPYAAALNLSCVECSSSPSPDALSLACAELAAGLSSMLGHNVSACRGGEEGGRVVSVSVTAATTAPANWPPQPVLEGYNLSVLPNGTTTTTTTLALASPSPQGALYGVWRLLALVQAESPALLAPNATVIEASNPAAPLRMWDLWDNLDGSIERGYAGPSIIYPLSGKGSAPDPARVRDFARLLSSVGLNAIVWDNVNACGDGNEDLLEAANLEALAPFAATLYAYGLHSFLTPCWTSPQTVGGLPTSDPRNATVTAWWDAAVAQVAATMPAGAFRGFLFKGDTEGQPGPGDYNLTELEGANYMGERLAAASALCIWRAFSHPPNGRTMPIDQALYQFQRFAGWDGLTGDNVVLQIKNGPYDFQVREPVHALFGALPHVSMILELEVTPEYLGQETHAISLPHQWATYLAFDLGQAAPTPAHGAATTTTRRGAGPPCTPPAGGTTLAGVIAGGTLCNAYSGIAGVSNLGANSNWTGHLLSGVNTFGFGRLAWAPAAADPDAVAAEWAALSFPGSAPAALDAVVSGILHKTWEAYENVTASLGWGFVCAFDHYHMDPASRTDYSNATKGTVGYSRGVPGGFGSVYNGEVGAAFLSLDTCPEELLLAFHTVPYSHSLKGAKYGNMTVLEWIYASHVGGAAASAGFASTWSALGGGVSGGGLNLAAYAVNGSTEADVFAAVGERLARGAADAAVFAANMTAYFQALTGAGEEGE
jgi:alpha-glucuronidase